MAGAARPVLLSGFAAGTAYLGYMLFGPEDTKKEERPYPSEKSRKEVFDKIARKWDDTVGFDEFVFGIGRWRRQMCRRAEGDVLEVAVGSARNFSYYDTRKVTSVTAVDFSRAMLEMAEKKKDELGSVPLKLKVCNVLSMDFPDGAFDTVVDTFGVCSFEKPVETLKEMRRVVKDDGKVLLLEHGAASWPYVQKQLNASLCCHVNKFGCYPNRDIQDLAKKAGFHISEDNRKHFGATYMLICEKHPPKVDQAE
eukprot:gnl/MRDRNA2_/MRDRNA2_100200_c0_seq1.p1 gnl/MRDRNA2_/MRDRNA2_100200_c0~~gnl/MRDRNA2_/MRDRNA2_100200_c0_seq1.p1  ORF type:complete len:253 (+),score=49.43 gnl/MRDRNA2_/MRDRNA2_100200_c0_seq1:111-869(+)